jgi:TfoX/Sxy family transcriptional regulator of competence genes
MKIPKPSEDDKARFVAMVPDDPRVEVKPMFGNLGAFVNGNMFMGLFGSDIGLKLPAEQAEQVAESGGGPFGPAERPMAGYVSLPVAMTGPEATSLIAESLSYVGALPPKIPKQRKK